MLLTGYVPSNQTNALQHGRGMVRKAVSDVPISASDVGCCWARKLTVCLDGCVQMVVLCFFLVLFGACTTAMGLWSNISSAHEWKHKFEKSPPQVGSHAEIQVPSVLPTDLDDDVSQNLSQHAASCASETLWPFLDTGRCG